MVAVLAVVGLMAVPAADLRLNITLLGNPPFGEEPGTGGGTSTSVLEREETKEQVERLKEVFTLLGVAMKAKPCKGMAGLLEQPHLAAGDAAVGILRRRTLYMGAPCAPVRFNSV